ncbi:hypothetical protein AKO1_007671 [Acrasis kona]|uniref:Uncharacterized protein n=1 Tax=Acrasis kona TaxID=1008807 RepID=A0AAW2YR72_9EUKA
MNPFPQLTQNCALTCPPPVAQVLPNNPTLAETAIAVEYGHRVKTMRMNQIGGMVVTDADVVNVEAWSRNTLDEFNQANAPAPVAPAWVGPVLAPIINNLNNINNNLNNINNNINNLRTHIISLEHNTNARVVNRSKKNTQDLLVPLHDNNNQAPPNFPATRGAFLAANMATCNALLHFYGQIPNNGLANVVKQQLCDFIGLDVISFVI